MFDAPPALYVANLTSLVWLRKGCRSRGTQAMRIFDLTVEDTCFYAGLSDDNIEVLCSELDFSLFVPRFDSAGLPPALARARRERDKHLSREIELHNLSQLQTLCEICQRSNGEAIWTYRIRQETVEAYRSLDHVDVVSLCKTLSVSAFVPRYSPTEMTRILDKPEGTKSLFAAAYETDIAASGEATRRSIYLTH